MKALAIFPDTYMGYGNETLRDIASRKIKRDLVDGECCIFVSRSKKACKILCANNTVIYRRNDEELTNGTIMDTPRICGGQVLKLGQSLFAEMRLLYPASQKEKANPSRKRA